MPQTTAVGGLDLSIVVPQRPAFLGGQTVSGYVSRQSDLVDPDATVVIQLIGRSKVKLHVRKGNSTSTYRSRFFFWGPGGLAVTLFRGPVHIAPGGHRELRCPFAITIPNTPDPNALQWEQEGRHPYLEPSQAASHSLPATFYHYASGYSYGRYAHGHCFVEYYLQASLQGHGSQHPQSTAILPITVRPVSSPAPITDIPTWPVSYPETVVAQQLNPDNRGAKLSMGQKVKELFHTSTVPHYTFSIEIGLPTQIQVGNPYPISFNLRAIPDQDSTSVEIRHVSQMVFIRRFDLELKSMTEFNASGLLLREAHRDSTRATLAHYEKPKHDEAFDLSPSQSVWPNEKGQASEPPRPADVLIIPPHDKGPPLDLGKSLNIVLRAPGKKRHDAARFASFTTYNIQHTHELKWHLNIVVAGKDKSIKGKQEVTVLGPSYDQKFVRDRSV